MQTFFNPHFHFNRVSYSRLLCNRIENYEFFFLSNPIVVSIYNYIHVVSESYYDPIVSLKLLLNSIEWKLIVSCLSNESRRF